MTRYVANVAKFILYRVLSKDKNTLMNTIEEFNKWYAEISGNQELKNNWQKFCDWISQVIEDIKKVFMSDGKKAELAELEHIRELFTEAFKATEKTAQERVNEQSAETKSSTNLEIKTNEEYNEVVSHSLKKKTPYNEYNTIGMQWAYSSSTQIGDRKILYKPNTSKSVLIEATKDGVGFIELKTGTYEQLREDEKTYESNKEGKFLDDEGAIDTAIHNFESGQNHNTWDNVDVGNRGTGIQNAEISKGKPSIDRTANSQIPDGNLEKKSFSLKDTKISMQDVRSVQSIGEIKGRISINDFDSNDIKATENLARKYYSELGVKSTFFRAFFGDWRVNDKTPVVVANQKGASRGITKNKDTGWDIQISGKVFNETTKQKNTAANIGYHHLDNIEAIVENAVLLNTSLFEVDDKSPNSFMMHDLYALSDTGHGLELVKLLVDEIYTPNSDNTLKRAYKLNGYKIIQLKAGSGLGNSAYSTLNSTGNKYSVADLFDIVKRVDKNFNPKPSSLVVNKDGTPKVVYHTTSDKFTVFDITKSRSWDGTVDYDLPGFYFAENYEDSAAYGDNTMACYVKITKPYSGNIYQLAKDKGSYRKAYEYLINQRYDGVIIDEFGEGFNEYIVFKSENIKSATDNIGSFDNSNKDINYSLKTLDNRAPSEIMTEIIDTVEDLQKGKKSAAGKLSKYVDNGIITTKYYNELIEKYGAIPTIEKMVEDGVFSYDEYSDKQAIEKAESDIKEYGWTKSLNDWLKDVENGVVSKQHTAMGWAIYFACFFVH